MKKIVLSAFAILTIGLVNAQDLKFGAKAGVNLATLSGDATNEDATMKVGFHAGGLMEVKFTDKLALQPELLFSLQGTKIDGRIDYGAGEYDEYSDKLNLAYINIPVMLKFYPIKSFFLEAGPQVGFLVGGKRNREFTEVYNDGNTNITNTQSSETDVKDLYKSIDFGFNVGLGYDFTENIFINARYNIGLSNISDVPSTFGFFPGVAELDRKNSVISLSFGFKF